MQGNLYDYQDRGSETSHAISPQNLYDNSAMGDYMDGIMGGIFGGGSMAPKAQPQQAPTQPQREYKYNPDVQWMQGGGPNAPGGGYKAYDPRRSNMGSTLIDGENYIRDTNTTMTDEPGIGYSNTYSKSGGGPGYTMLTPEENKVRNLELAMYGSPTAPPVNSTGAPLSNDTQNNATALAQQKSEADRLAGRPPSDYTQPLMASGQPTVRPQPASRDYGASPMGIPSLGGFDMMDMSGKPQQDWINEGLMGARNKWSAT